VEFRFIIANLLTGTPSLVCLAVMAALVYSRFDGTSQFSLAFDAFFEPLQHSKLL